MENFDFFMPMKRNSRDVFACIEGHLQRVFKSSGGNSYVLGNR